MNSIPHWQVSETNYLIWYENFEKLFSDPPVARHVNSVLKKSEQFRASVLEQ